ncbi:MAG: prephenate dehydratase [Candidatus Omnitrophica bacterium]|nr:prephenate dehydratase [Candidatus Omnitrophota bacterium]
MSPKKLSDLRKEIDKLDSRIVELVNRRGRVSRSIGALKKAGKQPLYSPDRESHVYSKVVKESAGPIADESMKAIYAEIMSACLALEHPTRVAYLGPKLTFTNQAALKKFGSSVDYLSCDSISDVFREVEKGNADYGVVPIENSTEGAVNHTLDMFVDSTLLICSEIYLPIRHSLLSKKGEKSSIKKIYSKSEVFGQCRRWIEKNYPKARLCECASTAKAADMVASRKDSACIASELAAKKYELKIIARSIEDSVTNMTRFLIIGKQMSNISGSDKTSIMFSVKDRPGVLHDMLSSFKTKNINLTKIESRPSKMRAWKYYFFVDLEGHCQSPKVRKALTDLEKKCHFVKILGSYPRGDKGFKKKTSK